MLINPIWFYLAELFDDIQIIAMSIMIILLCLLGFKAVMCLLDNDIIFFNKSTKGAIIVLIISAVICVVMPNKDTSIEMMIASQVNDRNMEKIKATVDYIIDKINEKEE